ncbi:MAG: dTDP-glucose 4,6-dehydratase [Ignavibacteria bacterium]|nr:dTDP-glucose 4,6-dehydratase [Ignavibacteria bacterium]
MQETLLITGGYGFIGSNFIRMLLDENKYRLVNLDALTYAGNPENLKEVENHPNYYFIPGTIQNRELVEHIISFYKITGIINFAAESHVDRSIMDSKPFYETNVIGTLNLLDCARHAGVSRFLQISTDEVYGSLGESGSFTENTPLSPNSPYSASKAAADQLVQAYCHTFGMNCVITRCSNNYGPYQFPEKLIPLMILNATEDKKLPVYGDGKNVRDWIQVEDHCRAILMVYRKGLQGNVYNIGADSEMENIDIVKNILMLLDKPESLIQYVKDRPGHDRRYAIDSSKIQSELGWKPLIKLEDGLAATVEWYAKNSKWTSGVRTGAYLQYYKKQYGGA